MLVRPRRKNDSLADHSIKIDLQSAFQWHTSRTITERSPVVLVQKWEPELLVGFRWRFVLRSHELIKVLTIKQVFLQFRQTLAHLWNHIFWDFSRHHCFGPVSALWLPVWSHPAVSQANEFMSVKGSVWNICHCAMWHVWNRRKSHHFLGCELCSLLWILLWLDWCS